MFSFFEGRAESVADPRLNRENFAGQARHEHARSELFKVLNKIWDPP